MYNYNQSQLDSLMQQKQLIEQRIQMMQQYQMPNININNMPQQPANFDFNGRWVNSADEAKGIANNNLPLILFDKNEPIFYMKNMDGSFKTFKFKEIVEQPKQSAENERIRALEEKEDIEGTEIDNNLRNMMTHFKQYVSNKKDYQINSNEMAKARCLESLNSIMYDMQKIMEELKTSSDFQQERDIIKTKLREMFSLYN